MDWRREDTGYALAAAAAVAIVVYLLAANLGIVPSPLSPLNSTPTAVAIEAPPVAQLPVIPVVASIPVSAHRPRLVPVGPNAPVDAAAPVIAFATKTGTQVSVAVPAVVKGVVKDVASGVDTVLVTFSSNGQRTVVPAALTCSTGARRDCSWSADVPGALGTYAVTAQAIDRAGNQKSAGPIDVSVVNTGGTVQQVTNVVGRVPALLTKTVNGLLGILGGGN